MKCHGPAVAPGRCKCSAHFLQWSKWVSEKKNLNASHLFGKLHFSLAPCLLKMLQEIIHSDVFLGVWWAFLVDPSYHGMVKSLFNESLYPDISGAYFISNSCRIPISMNRSGLVWEPVRVQGLKVQIAPLGKCFWKPKKKCLKFMASQATYPPPNQTLPSPSRNKGFKASLIRRNQWWYVGWEGRLTSPPPNYVATSHLAMVDLDSVFANLKNRPKQGPVLLT